MGMEDLCNTGLNLGLCPAPTNNTQKPNKVASAAAVASFEPYLTLSLSGDSCSAAYAGDSKKEEAAADHDQYPYGRQGSPHSSSFSSPGPGPMKRERDVSSDQEVEADDQRGVNYCEEEDDVGVNNARKKLRLTKEQSALLEQSFKHHSTLNPKQKQALARQLNLRPRQVEVWFQNRRARTKLKQTEVECELLKKCCETLTEENRRLQKEVQELKALKLGGAGGPSQPPSFYMHVPSSATLTMCPSCQRITEGATNSNNTPLFSSTKPHHFYNPFINNPYAAC